MYDMPEPMIHIRLDGETRKLLKSLAGAAGMDMTEYVTALIRRDLASLSQDERVAIDRLRTRLVAEAPAEYKVKKASGKR